MQILLEAPIKKEERDMKCKECKFYEDDVCKTVGKVCAYFTPKYCTGENCDECKLKSVCDKEQVV